MKRSGGPRIGGGHSGHGHVHNGSEEEENPTPIHIRALKRAVGGGTAGALSMVSQVATLMWLHTTINYQYAHGMTMKETIRSLYREGGVRRFYKGVAFALLQASVCKFGDTFANTGTMYFMNHSKRVQALGLPLVVKTAIGSVFASAWRVCLMPLDTSKVVWQTQGRVLIPMKARLQEMGFRRTFFSGSGPSFTSCFIAHLPWFFTFNALYARLPSFGESQLASISRTGLSGFVASVVASTVSNIFKVMKVKMQVRSGLTYRMLIQQNGLFELATRGLGSRILCTGCQGLLFSILWKYFESLWIPKSTL